MKFQTSLLEDWLRKYYFSAKYDLGSSGVRNFTVKDLYSLNNFPFTDLEELVFNDGDTFGSHKIRNLIANRFGDKDPESVLIGNGSNEVIYYVMNSLLSSGDEVIILEPIYYALENIPKALNCNVKSWKLEASDDFHPNLDNLKNLITTKTRMVIVNFPHNPTGVTLSLNELNYLIELVSSVNAYLVWDAAFQDLVYENPSLPNPYIQYKKTVYINTLTKCYGLAGLRLGWCISSPETIKLSEILKDYTSLYVSPLNEIYGIAAIENINYLLEHRLNDAKTNLQVLRDWVRENKNYLHCKFPQGGVSSFIKIVQQVDTEKFCKQLMDKEGVLLVPGKCFNYPSYVRLGLGSSPVDFQTGLNIISNYF